MKRVIVTGTREGLHDDGKALLLRRLYELKPCVLVEGGARGVDRQARGLAERLGLSVDTFQAEWVVYGKAAGPIRNQEMLEAGADLVLAFPGQNSKGTWDMIRRAKSAGVPVEIYRQ